MMGNMMNFLAYLFMGIPAGNMLVKIGYKKTALIAMAVGFLGLFTQYLSSLFGAVHLLHFPGGKSFPLPDCRGIPLHRQQKHS
jgi:fucose permease